MATSRRTTATTLAALALASLALTGCGAGATPSAKESPSPTSSSAPGGEQTTAEACTELKDGVTATMDELEGKMGDLQSDPTTAAAALDTLSAAFADTAEGIDNTEVRTVADNAVDALDTFSVQIHEYAKDPATADEAATTSAAQGLQKAMTALGETCP